MLCCMYVCTQADIAGVSQSSLPLNDGYSLVPTLQGKAQDQPKSVYNYYKIVCIN